MKGKLVVFAAGLSLAGMASSALHAGEAREPAVPSTPRDALGARSLEELTTLAESGSFEARLLLAEKFLLGKGVPRNVRMAVEWASRISDNVGPDQKARSSFIIDYAERLSAGRPWPQPAVSTRLMGKTPARPLPPPDAVLSALASEKIEPVNLMVGGTDSIDETKEVYDFLSQHYAYLLQGAGAEIGPALLPDGSVVYELTLTALRHPHLGEILCSILNLRLCLIYPYSPTLTLQADGAAADAVVDMRSAEAVGAVRQAAKETRRVAKARAKPAEEVRERKSIEATALADAMPPPPATRPGALPPLDNAAGKQSDEAPDGAAAQKKVTDALPDPGAQDSRERTSAVAGIALPADVRLPERASAEMTMPVEKVSPVVAARVPQGDANVPLGNTRVVHIGKGEYLISALRKAGVKDPETFLAVRPLRDIMEPDEIEVGTRIDVVEQNGRLAAYTIFLPERQLSVERRGERLFALVPAASLDRVAVHETASAVLPVADTIAASTDLPPVAPSPAPALSRASASIAMPSNASGETVVLHLDDEEEHAGPASASAVMGTPVERVAGGDVQSAWPKVPDAVSEAFHESGSIGLPERMKANGEALVPSAVRVSTDETELPRKLVLGAAAAEADLPVRIVATADMPAAVRVAAPVTFQGPSSTKVSSGDGMLPNDRERAVADAVLPSAVHVAAQVPFDGPAALKMSSGDGMLPNAAERSAADVSLPVPERHAVEIGMPKPAMETAAFLVDFPRSIEVRGGDIGLPKTVAARVAETIFLPEEEKLLSDMRVLPKPFGRRVLQAMNLPSMRRMVGGEAMLPKPAGQRISGGADFPLPEPLSVRFSMGWPRAERLVGALDMPSPVTVASTLGMDVPKILREVFDLRVPQPVRASLSIGWAVTEHASASIVMPTVETVGRNIDIPKPQSLRVALASLGISGGSLDDDVFPQPPTDAPSPLPLMEDDKRTVVAGGEDGAGEARSRLALLLKGLHSHGSFVNPAPIEPVAVAPLRALVPAPGTEKEAVKISAEMAFPEILHVDTASVLMPKVLHAAASIRMPLRARVASAAAIEHPVQESVVSGEKPVPVPSSKPAAPVIPVAAAPQEPVRVPPAPVASGLVVENVRFGLSKSLKEIVQAEGVDDTQIARILAVLEESLAAHGGRVTDTARLTRAGGRLMALELVEEDGARVGAFIGPDGSVSALYAPASGVPAPSAPPGRQPALLLPPVLAQAQAQAPAPAPAAVPDTVSAPAPIVAAQVPSPVDGMPPRIIPLGASSLPVRPLPGVSAWASRVETARSGESMSRLLARAGITEPDRARLLAALRRRVDTGVLSAGQDISIHRRGSDVAVQMALPGSSDVVLAWKEKGRYRVATVDAGDVEGGLSEPSRLVDKGQDIVAPQKAPVVVQGTKAKPAEENLPVVVAAGDNDTKLPPAPTTPVQIAQLDQPAGPAFAEDGSSSVRVMPLPNGGISSMGHVRRAVQPPVPAPVPVSVPVQQMQPAQPVQQAGPVQAEAPVAERPAAAQAVEPLPHAPEPAAPRLIPLDEPAPRGGAAPSVVRARPTGAAVYIQFSTAGSAEDAWLEVNRLRLALPRSVLAGLDLYAEPDGDGAYRIVASGSNSAPDLEGICQVISSRYDESCHLVNHLWTDNPK